MQTRFPPTPKITYFNFYISFRLDSLPKMRPKSFVCYMGHNAKIKQHT